MRFRSEPSGAASATSMLQSPFVASMAVDAPSTRGCSVTLNLCLARKRAMFPSVSSVAGGCATSFQLKVSGTSTMSNHLNAGVSVTSHTQQANRQCQCKNKQVGDDVAPMAVDQAVVPLAETHQADARDVDRNDGRDSNKATAYIVQGRAVGLPLIDESPSEESERNVRQRRAIRHDDQAARAVGKGHDVAAAAGSHEQADQRGVNAEDDIGKKLK